MQIKIGDFEYTEVWDGVFYKKLSDYPRISDWEMRTVAEFIEYEREHGRACEIECKDEALRKEILTRLEDREKYLTVPRPELLTECTACPYRKGCKTKFVCHTASPENAIKIFESGKLLSAVKARGMSGDELMREARNTAHDPADYFEYIMFNWGNCQAGDRLVMERKLGRFPNEDDLSSVFTPGVRFYFIYDDLAAHPKRVFDGVLPMKIRDELVLADYIYRIIVPDGERESLESHIPNELKDKVIYVKNDCRDIWDWNEKVYRIIENE